jgi:ketosteroid isomerase-like protein
MFKQRLMVAATVLGGLFLSGCQNQAPEANTTANTNMTANTAAAKTADPRIVEEVKKMLAAHDKALNDQNIDAVMATFANDPKVVVLGTGEGERFVGTEAIKNAYTEIFKDYEKGTLVTNCDWTTGGVDASGMQGWSAATCKASDSMNGVKREYVLNVSSALVNQDTGWHFIMLHMSNATGGGPPPDAKTTAEKPKSDKTETNQ